LGPPAEQEGVALVDLVDERHDLAVEVAPAHPPRQIRRWVHPARRVRITDTETCVVVVRLRLRLLLVG
jgi:hypothetical protein